MNLLFVNVSKNENNIMLDNAEAERYGHRVWNITNFPKSQYKSLRHIEYVSPEIESYKTAIQGAMSKYDIDYVTTQCEVLYPLLDEMQLPLLPIMDIPVDELVNKEKFYKFCVQHGIYHPPSIIPTTLEEIEHTFDRAIFVKPTNGTNGSAQLFRTADKYSMIDYLRYKNPREFLNVLQKFNMMDGFLHTQTHGKNMPKGKGIDGIKGRHIIQECVSSNLYIVVDCIIANGKISFTTMSKSINRFDDKIYAYDITGIGSEFLVLQDDDRSEKNAKEFLGPNAYRDLMNSLTTIVDKAGIKLAALNLSLIEYAAGRFFLQDLQFRPGGNRAKVIRTYGDDKRDSPYGFVRFEDLNSANIWRYV